MMIFLSYEAMVFSPSVRQAASEVLRCMSRLLHGEKLIWSLRDCFEDG